MRKLLVGVCVAIAVCVVIWWWYIFLSPNWLWVSYDSINVDDGVAGQPSPMATASIVYYQPMLVEWDRTLYQETNENSWQPVCTTEGKAARYPAYLPSKTNLAGMFDGKECARNLDPGEYYVEDNLTWTNVIERTVSVESDSFFIEAPPPTPPAVVRGRPTPPAVVAPPVAHQARLRRLRHKASCFFPLCLFLQR